VRPAGWGAERCAAGAACAGRRRRPGAVCPARAAASALAACLMSVTVSLQDGGIRNPQRGWTSFEAMADGTSRLEDPIAMTVLPGHAPNAAHIDSCGTVASRHSAWYGFAKVPLQMARRVQNMRTSSVMRGQRCHSPLLPQQQVRADSHRGAIQLQAETSDSACMSVRPGRLHGGHAALPRTPLRQSKPQACPRQLTAALRGQQEVCSEFSIPEAGSSPPGCLGSAVAAMCLVMTHG